MLQPHTHSLCDTTRSILRPIAYFSRKLNETQQRYSAQERELLGILLALQHWRHWVEGSDVTVITDHESLRTIQTKAEQPARMLRFLDSIEHYGIRIVYRRGTANVLANYLSRPSENNFLSEEEEGAVGDIEQRELDEIKYPEQLDRIYFLCIFEFLLQNQELPSNLTVSWVKRNFGIYNAKLYRVISHQTTSIGIPP